MRTVHLLYVSDEEIEGFDGAAKFVESNECEEFNVGFVLEEEMRKQRKKDGNGGGTEEINAGKVCKVTDESEIGGGSIGDGKIEKSVMKVLHLGFFSLEEREEPNIGLELVLAGKHGGKGSNNWWGRAQMVWDDGTVAGGGLRGNILGLLVTLVLKGQEWEKAQVAENSNGSPVSGGKQEATRPVWEEFQ